MNSTHEEKKHTSKQQTIAYVVILLEFLIIIALGFKLYYGHNPYISFDLQYVHKKNDIQNKDSLTCHVSYTTHGESGISLWQYEITEFEIWDINTNTPKLVLNGNPWGEFKIINNDENYISLQITSNWDIDSISINKSNGTYIRAMLGDHAIWTDFAQYAIAQKGWCE